MKNNMFDIRGKKAIVTGASKGLGLGAAEALLEGGCEVVLVASSDLIYDVSDSFISEGYAAHAIRGDLGNREDILTIFDKAIKILGGVDILVTAAGIQRRNRSDKFLLEDWDEVLEVNLSSVFILCQLAGQKMIQKGKGKIINFASMNSFYGGINIPAYAASKGGIAQLTKCLSNDWAKFGINVNAIAPGYMKTEMNKNLLNDDKRLMELNNRIPAGRWGTSDDIKGTCIFLASNASDYLCGAIIPVDGGYLVC